MQPIFKLSYFQKVIQIIRNSLKIHKIYYKIKTILAAWNRRAQWSTSYAISTKVSLDNLYQVCQRKVIVVFVHFFRTCSKIIQIIGNSYCLNISLHRNLKNIPIKLWWKGERGRFHQSGIKVFCVWPIFRHIFRNFYILILFKEDKPG
jgi:hypothetical protein